MKDKAFLGIDPGVTGSVAIITPDFVDIMDWTDPICIIEQVKEWNTDYDLTAMVEKIHAMPKGSIGNFKKGENYGMWQMILLLLCIPCFKVTIITM